MKIDVTTVRKIASLARLGLSEEELLQLTPELSGIIDYFDTLSELTVADTPADFNHDLPGAFRPDKKEPSMIIDEALKNAPDPHNRYFRVLKVIDDESL